MAHKHNLIEANPVRFGFTSDFMTGVAEHILEDDLKKWVNQP